LLERNLVLTCSPTPSLQRLVRFSLFPDIAPTIQRAIRRVTAIDVDGYRLAKAEGKPKLAKACRGSEKQTFSFSPGACAAPARLQAVHREP
jgi:hypothetical protein